MHFLLSVTWLAAYVWVGEHGVLLATTLTCAVQPLVRARTVDGG